MANVIWIIIGFLFCAIAGYGIGLHRGIKVSDGLYDEGWLDCEEHMRQYYEVEDDEDKYEKARKMIRELDELFNENDDNVIDGGYYD